MCTVPDPAGLKAFIDYLGKEKLDSKFPTINQCFSKSPTMGIAWAVDDFLQLAADQIP